ncbi:hypothetical protein FRB99_007044 [Tulasnella sp. 403]|nr:hypothetical protein FRB99_007044 [Tulasnella sp. 403]
MGFDRFVLLRSDVRAIQRRLQSVDNLVNALFSTVGMSRDARESIAQGGSAESLQDVIASLVTTGPSQPEAPPPILPDTRRPFMTVRSNLPSRGVLIDPATKIYSSSTTFIPLDDLLGLWSETLGMRMYPLAGQSIKRPDGSFVDGGNQNGDRGLINLVSVHSELDNQSWTTSPNLAALNLAYKMFVSPALFNSTPDGKAPPLVNRSHIAYLPGPEVRHDLWAEFEAMMVLHAGLATKELKKRVDSMFAWADAGARPDQGTSSDDQLLSPPTLAFFSVACAAFAIGAQARECFLLHGGTLPVRGSLSANTDSGDATERPSPTATAMSRTPSRQSISDLTIGTVNPTISSHDGMWLEPISAPNSSPDADPALAASWDTVAPRVKDNQRPATPTAQELFNLSIATRIAHDQLDLPPSLDYIVAHLLAWQYLLHPADTSSLSSKCKGTVSGGGPTSVDHRVWKELGKVVNVARLMGLGIDPERGTPGRDTFSMSLWEKEMRRRIWWELCFYDSYLSDCLGQEPLIDLTQYDCRIPRDVNETQFHPSSTTIPAPTEKGTLKHNLSHFVIRCKLVQLSQQIKRHRYQPEDDLEEMIAVAKETEAEITKWKEKLPKYLTIDFASNADEANRMFPDTDVTAIQAWDLYAMANSLIIRLWTPFFLPSLTGTQLEPYPITACYNAAHIIITASEHMRVRFRDTRPVILGYYAYGRTSFLAGAIAAAVAIFGSGSLDIAMPAIQDLETCHKIVNDAVVCGLGRPDPKSFRFEASRVTELLVRKANNTFGARTRGATWQEGEQPWVENLNLRPAFELPYVGRGIVTMPGSLDFDYGPPRRFTSLVVAPEPPPKPATVTPEPIDTPMRNGSGPKPPPPSARPIKPLPGEDNGTNAERRRLTHTIRKRRTENPNGINATPNGNTASQPNGVKQPSPMTRRTSTESATPTPNNGRKLTTTASMGNLHNHYRNASSDAATWQPQHGPPGSATSPVMTRRVDQPGPSYRSPYTASDTEAMQTHSGPRPLPPRPGGVPGYPVSPMGPPPNPVPMNQHPMGVPPVGQPMYGIQVQQGYPTPPTPQPVGMNNTGYQPNLVDPSASYGPMTSPQVQSPQSMNPPPLQPLAPPQAAWSSAAENALYNAPMNVGMAPSGSYPQAIVQSPGPVRGGGPPQGGGYDQGQQIFMKPVGTMVNGPAVPQTIAIPQNVPPQQMVSPPQPRPPSGSQMHPSPMAQQQVYAPPQQLQQLPVNSYGALRPSGGPVPGGATQSWDFANASSGESSDFGQPPLSAGGDPSVSQPSPAGGGYNPMWTGMAPAQ